MNTEKSTQHTAAVKVFNFRPYFAVSTRQCHRQNHHHHHHHHHADHDADHHPPQQQNKKPSQTPHGNMSANGATQAFQCCLPTLLFPVDREEFVVLAVSLVDSLERCFGVRLRREPPRRKNKNEGRTNGKRHRQQRITAGRNQKPTPGVEKNAGSKKKRHRELRKTRNEGPIMLLPLEILTGSTRGGDGCNSNVMTPLIPLHRTTPTGKRLNEIEEVMICIKGAHFSSSSCETSIHRRLV